MKSQRSEPLNAWNCCDEVSQELSESGDSSITLPLVTRLVRSRTVEMAIHAGRRSHEIRQSDYERAKREVTGETDFARQQAMLYPVR